MMHYSRGRAELFRGTSALKQIIVSISLLAVLPSCTGLGSSSPNGQAADARRLPIIDMHMHATPLEAYPSAWGTPPFRNPATGELSAATNNEAMAASVRAMIRFNIIKAVVSGPPDRKPTAGHLLQQRSTLSAFAEQFDCGLPQQLFTVIPALISRRRSRFGRTRPA